ncbi:MAG: YitT family protein [Bacteroidetes bacterium]|nr:YitT family protein [Bacteroidota bacterium]MBL6943828.1 YitT family protein [Bacteroidales bacterium]
MVFIQKDKIFSIRWIKNYSMILIGAFIMASGFVLFITPYKIVPGGVYGISIVLHYLIGTPVGMMALAFDIPLTLIGIKILGPRFGVKTVVGFIATAVMVDTLTYFYGNEPLVADDALLSSIFGGLFIGVGLGLIFKAKATSGGSDIVAMIVSKYTKMPLGQLMIIVDSIIVLVGLVAFQDWKIPLYSLIVIFITGKVVDVILEGMSYDKVLFIVSEKTQEIRDKIVNDLNRGGTIVKGEGMFSGQEKSIAFTAVSRREMAMLQEFIHHVDPNAFVTVLNSNEILGNGFKSLKDKIED